MNKGLYKIYEFKTFEKQVNTYFKNKEYVIEKLKKTIKRKSIHRKTII